MDDTSDAKARIGKASKTAGALNFVWKSNQIYLETKKKLHLAIPLNLALLNGETWSGNKADLESLDVFHHKTIRKILGINMLQVKDERITNEKLRMRFNNIKSLSEIWRYRVLKFIGRVARQNPSALPRKFLSASIDNKIAVGRPFRKCKDATVESIRILILSTLTQETSSIGLDMSLM